uniref:uncharacterized protein LOC120339215 n=1 Tax=Styela clava TaxID=7725 RepID=UPI001939E998|nr:uncharacterized protein LOC120339215 [Styela clava]
MNSAVKSQANENTTISKSPYHSIVDNVALIYLPVPESVQVLGRTRLSPSHVELTPYSKMKVNLATDGLSWNVGQCLKTMNGTNGTAKFVLMFAKWYEIVNCSCNCPIRCVDDDRLSWLKNDFIGSLLEWENEHGGDEKSFLARPTLEGLKFTTHNFIEMCKYLLANGLEYVSLHCFNQDVLEAFFGNLVRFFGGLNCMGIYLAMYISNPQHHIHRDNLDLDQAIQTYLK